MDELLHEFLTETNERLAVIDAELVRFEQHPNNTDILANIFRLVHTIKGTCGFLGLPRLEALAHAAETVMDQFRNGLPVTGTAVTLILATVDRIKELLDVLERRREEPAGLDRELIAELEQMALAGAPATLSEANEQSGSPGNEDAGAGIASGSPAYQVLERALRPGEVPLDALERAFRETATEQVPRAAAAAPASAAAAPQGLRTPSANDDERPDVKLGDQSIRVNVATLEHLMTMISELVLTRNQLIEIARRHENCEFKGPLDRLSNVTAALQEGVMRTPMQPIGRAFQQLPRIVRDIAAEQHKEIDVDMNGADTELDRAVLELIKDPLAHMVRNSADHGLETPDERRALGKPERGVIRLGAYHEGSSIIVEVADDGRGLNTEKIRTQAIANGLATAAEIAKMSEARIHKFIFMPGFSTAAQVTSVSGRGVGLDVVGTNIDLIGGTIDVKSVPCEGARFLIKIPLTLATVSALIVEVGGNRFAVPQLSVIELVRVAPHSRHCIERIKDAPVLRLRNKLLPLVHLWRLLNAGDGAGGEPEDGFIVVARVGRQTFGIVVDGAFHTEEIVVKPLASKLRHIALFSGIAILGDGSVIMIVDPNGIAREIGTSAPDLAAEEEPRGAAAEKSALLIFYAGSDPPKAVPLSLVTRIEQIDAAKIETSCGRPVAQYRGALMPLLGVEPGRQPNAGRQLVLVFSEHGRALGLMVDRIVDIVEDELKIGLASARPGMLGSAIVRGQATEILDIGHYLPLAFPDGVRRSDKSVGRRSLSLVLVDDSAFFRDMLTAVLRAAGYDVTALASGEEALACLRSGRAIDALVTDIEMPRMDGYELASAIRRDARMANVPIIALASAFSPDALRRGRLAGFQGHVAKFDRPGLVAALERRLAQGA